MDSLKNKIAKLNSFIPLDDGKYLSNQSQNTIDTENIENDDKISNSHK